jgi:hypothetical protein
MGSNYLNELPSFDPDCLFIVEPNGLLRKLHCPFKVKLTKNVPNLKLHDVYDVQAVMVSREGLLVYYVLGKAYFYFNFEVLI